MLVLILLLPFAFGDILQLDRWPVLEAQAKGDAESMFRSLLDAHFPPYSQDTYEAGLAKTLQIWNFRLIEVKPRLMFMTPTFYQPPYQDTYTVNVPLGFHMTAEFEWIYNHGIIPISGKATFDTDVHSLAYNVTLNSYPPDKINVTIQVDYSIVPVSEIHVSSLFKSNEVAALLLKAMPGYLPLVKKTTEAVFTEALNARYNNIFPKSMEIKLYYPTFQYYFNMVSNIYKVTTRGALLLAYGKEVSIPDVVPASEWVRRQYCVEEGLLDTIVEKVWPHMKAVFKNVNLPSDSSIPITFSGLAMLVPDVVNDFDRNSDVKVSIGATAGKQNIQLSKLNETHGKASGFKIDIGFHVEEHTVLNVSLSCDFIVTPHAVKLGDSFVFNVRPIFAIVQYDTINTQTDYKTYIMSNIREMTLEYVNGLLLPYLGYSLLGNGLNIKDSVTPYARAEYSITSDAVCLNLAVTSS